MMLSLKGSLRSRGEAPSPLLSESRWPFARGAHRPARPFVRVCTSYLFAPWAPPLHGPKPSRTIVSDAGPLNYSENASASRAAADHYSITRADPARWRPALTGCILGQ